MFRQYMLNWGAGRSYPIRILGGPDSAVVVLTNTPELFGDELHIMSSVDLLQDRVVRWTDYWDSTDFDDAKRGPWSARGTPSAPSSGSPPPLPIRAPERPARRFTTAARTEATSSLS